MFKKLFSSGPWLKSIVGTDRLYTLELCNVKDCFNANELWEAQYSGNNGIIESKTKKSENRLQKALSMHCMIGQKMDEKGKIRRTKFTFSDVIVHIPKEIYLEDVRDNGQQLMMLNHNLCILHEKNLTNFWKKRNASYAITYHDLEKDKVIFQFGSSVFIPGANDKLLAGIQIKSKNGEWLNLPHWSFWLESWETKRPAGVYMNQDHMILGQKIEKSSIFIPDCFSNEDSYVHINCNQRKAYGDGINNTKTGTETRENNSTTFELSPLSESENSVIIKWTDNSIPTPGICLSGYALLKNKKVSSWFIWLDNQGMPCDFSNALVYFQGANNRLHARKNNQKVYTDLKFQNSIAEFEGYTIKAPPEELLSDYIGLLSLPRGFQNPLSDMISNKKMTIGRTIAEDRPDIPLDYFSDPQSIRSPGIDFNGVGNTNLGQINLSRKQAILTWQASTGKLFIQQISTSAPIYILKTDPQKGELYKETLNPKSGREVEISITDRLVIGTYILGFQSAAIGGTI